MAAPPAEHAAAAGDWYEIIKPAAILASLAIIGFITSYFNKKTDKEPDVTPSGTMAAKAVGAAFVDIDAGRTLSKISEDVNVLRKISEERAADEHKAELALEAARIAAELLKKEKERRP